MPKKKKLHKYAKRCIIKKNLIDKKKKYRCCNIDTPNIKATELANMPHMSNLSQLLICLRTNYNIELKDLQVLVA